METQRFVNDVEAAKLLSVSPQTIRNWRYLGKGPRYAKRGRLVRYGVDALINYMNEGIINPEDPAK
ncbi:MAG: helix-turn-helix transcriptional regulator [Desulfobacteraceae bacterium]